MMSSVLASHELLMRMMSGKSLFTKTMTSSKALFTYLDKTMASFKNLFTYPEKTMTSFKALFTYPDKTMASSQKIIHVSR